MNHIYREDRIWHLIWVAHEPCSPEQDNYKHVLYSLSMFAAPFWPDVNHTLTSSDPHKIISSVPGHSIVVTLAKLQ